MNQLILPLESEYSQFFRLAFLLIQKNSDVKAPAWYLLILSVPHK